METEVLQSYLSQITKLLERLVLAAEQINLEQSYPPLPAASPASSAGQVGAVMAATVRPPATFAENVSQWVCPVHGSFKVVPAGVSQRTGKSYTAFIACDSPGCNEKPGRFSVPPARLP